MRIIPRIPPNQELPISRLAPLPSLKNPSPSPRRFQKPHLRDKTETESQESDNEGTINNFEKKNTFAKK